MDREKANHAIAMLCRVLEVSTSGYYAWRKRGPSDRDRVDAELTERIGTIHRESRGTYGSPRVHAELADGGIRCGRKRVARLMRAGHLVGCHRRRTVITARREVSAPPAPDRVSRQFVAEAPNTMWTADITYVPTWMGFLYLAVVLDVYSRRIVHCLDRFRLRRLWRVNVQTLFIATGQNLKRYLAAREWGRRHGPTGSLWVSFTAAPAHYPLI
ncbi:MAG: IS3 family transposase [Chloroflexota bacterium]